MAEASPDGPIRVRLSPPDQSPPPEAANFFYFTFLGPDVQMLVGYVDPRTVHEARLRGEEVVVTPHVAHRIALSARGFQHLRKQLEEIAKLYDQMNPPQGVSSNA
jgi:hypothetical protein